MGPTGKSSVLQIHPTRRCNLRCLHCYSASAPEERDRLDPSLFAGAIQDAAAEGYTVVSFSGGEPLVYRPLGELLEEARACGMRTALTTNGMLLDEKRVQKLQGRLDLAAISLDGTPAAHNRMRNSPVAFEKMNANLPGLRESGIPFGFIFTLTQYNLDELDWALDFALEHGASLLQIHPLEEAGRAAINLAGSRPDALEGTMAYLEAVRLQQKAGDRLYVQVDLLSRDALKASPERVYASGEANPSAPLAQLISPLVIEADGTVTPLQYGFARSYTLGSLLDAPLRSLASGWKRERLASFHQLCRQVYAGVIDDQAAPLFNWYEAMGQASHSREGELVPASA